MDVLQLQELPSPNNFITHQESSSFRFTQIFDASGFGIQGSLFVYNSRLCLLLDLKNEYMKL